MPVRLNKFSRALKRAWAMAVMSVAAMSGLAGTASAQGLPLIRDSEIEALMADYARPILKAAGLGTGRVTVRIIKNDAFNAFVLEDRKSVV